MPSVPKKKRSRSKQGKRNQQKGAEIEREAAEFLRPVPGWQDLKRRPRQLYGPPQSDFIDEMTPWLFESKNMQTFPAKPEKALDQADGYAEHRVDVAAGIVLMSNSPGPGKKREWRVYYDAYVWREEQILRETMAQVMTDMNMVAAPLVKAMIRQYRDGGSITLSQSEVDNFLMLFGEGVSS